MSSSPLPSLFPHSSWWEGPVPSWHREAGLDGVQGEGGAVSFLEPLGFCLPRAHGDKACQLLLIQRGSDSGALVLTRNSSSSCVGLGGRCCRACRLRGRPAERRKCSVTSWGVRTGQMGSTAPRDRTSSIRAVGAAPAAGTAWSASAATAVPAPLTAGSLSPRHPEAQAPAPLPLVGRERGSKPAAASRSPLPIPGSALSSGPPRPGGSGPLEGAQPSLRLGAQAQS